MQGLLQVCFKLKLLSGIHLFERIVLVWNAFFFFFSSVANLVDSFSIKNVIFYRVIFYFNADFDFEFQVWVNAWISVAEPGMLLMHSRQQNYSSACDNTLRFFSGSIANFYCLMFITNII